MGFILDMLIYITTLVGGVVLFVFSLHLLRQDKATFDRNHSITGGVSNAIVGDLHAPELGSSDEISKGFTVDIRNGELVPCSQLSHEAVR